MAGRFAELSRPELVQSYQESRKQPSGYRQTDLHICGQAGMEKVLAVRSLTAGSGMWPGEQCGCIGRAGGNNPPSPGELRLMRRGSEGDTGMLLPATGLTLAVVTVT